MTRRNIKTSKVPLQGTIQGITMKHFSSLSYLLVICVWLPPRLGLNTFLLSILTKSPLVKRTFEPFAQLQALYFVFQDHGTGHFCRFLWQVPLPLGIWHTTECTNLKCMYFHVSINPNNHQRNQDTDYFLHSGRLFCAPPQQKPSIYAYNPSPDFCHR